MIFALAVVLHFELPRWGGGVKDDRSDQYKSFDENCWHGEVNWVIYHIYLHRPLENNSGKFTV